MRSITMTQFYVGLYHLYSKIFPLTDQGCPKRRLSRWAPRQGFPRFLKNKMKIIIDFAQVNDL